MQKIAPYTITPRFMDTHPEANNGRGSKDSLEILIYNSNALLYVSINAIKELSQKNKELEKMISARNEEIKSLEARLRVLENMLNKAKLTDK